MNFFKMIWDYFFKKPEPQPEPLKDDIDISKVHWRSQTEPTGINAQITCNLWDVSRKGGTIYFKHDKRDWKIQAGGSCDCTICLFKVYDDGTSDGGKFDHDYPNSTSKPLNHMIKDGYIDNRHPNDPKILPPVDNDTWALCQVSYDGKFRTPLKTLKW